MKAAWEELRTRRSVFRHTTHRRKDGTVFPVIVVERDITERKKAEEERVRLEGQLYQAQKMESIGRLAGGVAHDFNNMLGVILGNAESALDEVDVTSPIRQELKEIVRAADRSADLTRQLLAFARKQTVTPKVLHLNATVSGMLRLLKRLIGEDVKVTWRPGAGLWRLKVDPSQIDQTLTNLSVNARDAIIGVGNLTIETCNVSVDEEYGGAREVAVPGDYVRLAVRDDGCGMDKNGEPRPRTATATENRNQVTKPNNPENRNPENRNEVTPATRLPREPREPERGNPEDRNQVAESWRDLEPGSQVARPRSGTR